MMRTHHLILAGLAAVQALHVVAYCFAADAPAPPAPVAAPTAPAAPAAPTPPAPPLAPRSPQAAAAEARSEAPFAPGTVYADQMLSEDTVWRGEVLVQGAVTVAPQATLTIEPGTVVRFKRKEGRTPLLVVQGRLAATGTKESPIVFTSAFVLPAAGDWQGVMLLGSEKKNLMENCRIEGAQTGFEALFSNVTLKNVRADRCGTGMRFQDALVLMDGGGAGDCETGLLFSQSEATLRNLTLAANRRGLSARQSSVYLQDSGVSVNRSAVFAENCRVKIVGGSVIDNGSGIALSDCQGGVTGVTITRNGDFGLSLTASRVRVTGNEITGNRDGLLVYDGGSAAWDNAVYGNGEYDLYNAGKEEFRAPGNWWGESGPRIFDNAGQGRVLTAPLLSSRPKE